LIGADHARRGRPAVAHFAKLNALVDFRVIEALYRASQAGVPIEMIGAAFRFAPGLRGSPKTSASRASSIGSWNTAGCSHLVRRRGESVSVERRLDAAQFPPPRRGDVSRRSTRLNGGFSGK